MDNRDLGTIFRMRKDIRQAAPKADNISPSPDAITNPTGIWNVQVTIPRFLKNTAVSGFITKQLAKSPRAVEPATAGIKLNAV